MVSPIKKLSENSQKNHQEMNSSGRQSRILIYIINMIYFALSILVFTVGIVYLTGFMYDYSLTIYSTTLIAGIFVAVGTLVAALAILNVVIMNVNKQVIVLAISVALLVLFLILLGFGIWGVVANYDNDSLAEEVRKDLEQTLRGYQETEYYKYETKKINWVQGRFNCCGIHSYQDWRSYYLYGGQAYAVSYIDQWSVNNNLPYIDYVPDSCCVNRYPGCGQQFYNKHHPDSMERDRLIFTKGCVYNFISYFYRDIMFLSIFSLSIGAVGVVLWIILVSIYVSLHIKYR